jgi:hypothetical protein
VATSFRHPLPRRVSEAATAIAVLNEVTAIDIVFSVKKAIGSLDRAVIHPMLLGKP